MLTVQRLMGLLSGCPPRALVHEVSGTTEKSLEIVVYLSAIKPSGESTMASHILIITTQ
jgi:hypothetical protein